MKSFYQYFSVDIPANSTREINVYGRNMVILSWDGTLDAEIRLGDQPEQTFPAGIAVELPVNSGGQLYFNKALIRNPNGSTATLKIAFSAGKIDDRRLTLSGTTFSDILAELRGETAPQGFGLVSVGTTVTKVVASNTDRKSVLIQNPPTNTGLMYIGYDNTVLATKYVAVISPGQIFSCDDYRGDLWALGTVASEKVSYGEV